MPCRKNVNALTPAEKAAFVNAVLTLKQNGDYNQYVQMHVTAMNHATPPGVASTVRNAAHRGPAFLPWHREFLRRFEIDLQAIDPSVTIPYWDWATDAALADPATAPVWAADLMGGDGDPGDDNIVKTGPFAFDPADPNTWTIANGQGADTGNGLQRNFGNDVATLPTQADVDFIQALTPYDAAPWNRDSTGGYRNANEGWGTVNGSTPPPANTHNRVHRWVGGSMIPGSSPNDPVFFLHHAFVDKLWADWQAAHPGENFLPGPGASNNLDGHRRNDEMFPWTTRIADVLDHKALGYRYDTDAPDIHPDTPALTYVDVPQGAVQVRAARFEIASCAPTLTFTVTAGPDRTSGPPGDFFGLPAGASVTVPASPTGTAELLISFRGTVAGSTTSGTVTIECVETGEAWDIALSGNTVAKPTVGAVLVLDQSGSMNHDAGDGRQRIDVLRDAAPVFVDLLGDDDSIGVVRFDHDAHPGTPVATAGAPAAGAGRIAANDAITAHSANPAGNTSIGNGIMMASDDLDAPSAPAAETRAIVVLTDGRENTPQYIADIGGIIGTERVFGIGLGTAAHIDPAALTALTNGTGGYVLMTGTLDTDDYFLLEKYYLQILAGVTNAEVVLDPEGWLQPGDSARIPFVLSDADTALDAILLSGGADPQTFRFDLETPTGHLIERADTAALPEIDAFDGRALSAYRSTLPLTAAGFEETEGRWHAIVSLDPDRFKRHLLHLAERQDMEALRRAKAHGLRYSVNIQARSGISLRAALTQSDFEPGADLTLHARLTQYGVPLDNGAQLTADLTHPDGTTQKLAFTETLPGAFETGVLSSLPGIYRFHLRASGKTLRGRPFTREQLLTGAVWEGGNAPPPRTPPGGGSGRGDADRLCKFLDCLLSRDSIQRKLKEHEIDPGDIARCLERACSGGRDPRSGNAEPTDDLLALLRRAASGFQRDTNLSQALSRAIEGLRRK